MYFIKVNCLNVLLVLLWDFVLRSKLRRISLGWCDRAITWTLAHLLTNFFFSHSKTYWCCCLHFHNQLQSKSILVICDCDYCFYSTIRFWWGMYCNQHETQLFDEKCCNTMVGANFTRPSDWRYKQYWWQ